MKCFLIVLLLLITATLSSASELSDQIEKQILSKDWKGVYFTLNNLNSKSLKEKEYFRKVTESTKAVMGFIRDYDLFESLADNEAMPFRKALINRYNSLPKKLPFSQRLIDDINAMKSNINNRFAAIDEERKRKREELKALREEEKQRKQKIRQVENDRRETELAELEERKRARMEDERIEQLKHEELRIQQEKEKADREKYQSAQQVVEHSPEYIKADLVCKICSAIAEKKAIDKALVKDARYARRYGVVNLTRRDDGVQMIKSDDMTIQEGKTSYKEQFKKSFDPAECKKINCDACDETLHRLSKKLTDKYLAEQK